MRPNLAAHVRRVMRLQSRRTREDLDAHRARARPTRKLEHMEKPEIDFVDPEPPTDLVITDLTVGDGAEAASGNNVSVHYVGVAHSTGEEFDASYNRGEPLKFRLGVGQVIQGWDTGVQGMKVGGRRQLVIPPHLGYGDRGAGGVIKPGETLVFVVDLLDVG